MSASEEPEVTPWPPHNTQSQPEEKKRGEKSTCSESFVQMPSSSSFLGQKDQESKYCFPYSKPLSFGGFPSTCCVFIYQRANGDTPVTFQHFHGSCHFLVSLDVVLASVLGFVSDGCDV